MKKLKSLKVDKFWLLITTLSIIILNSCSQDPSQKIFNSTLDIIGNSFGPGYSNTNGNPGRSYWKFNNNELELEYSAMVMGSVKNSTEKNLLTNFTKHVHLDENLEIPATWSIYADWGNARYWITLEHYKEGEYNDYFDDEKKSKKNQWALIHYIKWNDNAWAKYLTYLSDDQSNNLLGFFEVDKNSEDYKISLSNRLKKDEEDKKKRMDFVNEFLDKENLINHVEELTENNLLVSVNVEDDLIFKIRGETLTLDGFFSKLTEISENEFDENIKKYNVKITNEDLERTSYGDPSLKLRRDDKIIFYKENGKENLSFKFVVRINKANPSSMQKNWGYRTISSKDFYKFYRTGGIVKDGRINNYSKERFFSDSNYRLQALFYVYKSIFHYLQKNVGSLEIEGVNWMENVLVIPLDSTNEIKIP